MVARFLWPALIIGVLVVAAVVSAAGEETRVELDYLESIRDQAEDLSRSGTAIADVMSRIAEIGRDEFTTVLQGVSQDLDVAQAFVADEPPTESLVPVWALYRQTVTLWDDGVSGLTESILQAADNPDDRTIVNTIGDALADLRAGDSLYEDLKVEVEREEIPAPVSPLVDITMNPSQSGVFNQSSSYFAAARSSNNELGLRPGLRVSQVISDPEWEVNVESEAVVPPTETVQISAVITNSGNVASAPESVGLTLNGGAEPVVAQAEVPALQPDGQTTVEFDELEVIADTPYEVTVALVLNNPDFDSEPTDNEQVVEFTVSGS